MPHLIVEHSANLSETHDLQRLSDELRTVIDETGIFPLAGVRVRFHPSEVYTIADSHPDNGFLAIIMRVGAGRDVETKQKAGQAVFDHACAFFAGEIQAGTMMVSVDIEENNPELTFKKNGVHGRLSAS